VLLAAESPIGVVFRRGPSKLVRVILLNRETDKFTAGQWFKGKIYPDRSDLSPDGRHMIYFAMGGVAWAIPKTGGTWTAISRVPSLTALALWPQGDTWCSGGMFTSNSSYWLDTHHESLRNDTKLKRVFVRPAPSRMERDGWVRKETSRKAKLFVVFEKEMPKGWILRMRQNYLIDRYELQQREHGLTLEFPTWEWADLDRKRLVWAEQGCLRAARIEPRKLGAAHTLYDFNGMTPTNSAG
jgi:hypothetical protein